MGNNSVFDDLGIGASDLGLSPDPDDVKAENERTLAALEQNRETEKEELQAEEEVKQEEVRTSRPRGRSRTLLTGGQGLTDENLNVSRRTLLGS